MVRPVYWRKGEARGTPRRSRWRLTEEEREGASFKRDKRVRREMEQRGSLGSLKCGVEGFLGFIPLKKTVSAYDYVFFFFLFFLNKFVFGALLEKKNGFKL
jgi:hypothetical protein